MRRTATAVSATPVPSRRKQRSWLQPAMYDAVVLDPARWSDRSRQIAFWCVCETWYRSQRLH